MAIQVAALYLPLTQFALSLEPISARTWVEIVAVGLSVIVVAELHKLARARWPIGSRALASPKPTNPSGH